MRHRERTIAAAGARDITGVTGLGRLVIMVDEFAAMLAEHPDLHALFADLAARGRSLGIHLVLCTQRPSGAVRDAVLANADLRISLRVNNRADSAAVIGTDAAASIPAQARGRALVSLADQDPVLAQFARASDADVLAAAARWLGSAPARRPWIEPLPALIHLADVDQGQQGSHAFGLLDRPDEQRREVACWTPGVQGNLLVLGGPGAGASTALSAVAEAVATPTGFPRRSSPPGTPSPTGSGIRRPGVLVADDLDALVGRFPAEHRAEFTDRLVRLAREGPAAGAYLAAGMRRVPGELQVLASLLPARLLLRHSSRQDFVLAGGDGAAHDGTLGPGAGMWLGARVQVAVGAVGRPADPLPSITPLTAGTSVGGRDHPCARGRRALAPCGLPAALAGHGTARCSGTGSVSTGGSAARIAVVGDVDEWQARWGVLPALRPVAAVVFDACSIGDLRQLARSRQVPPPIGAGQAWLLGADGVVHRTVLPGGTVLPNSA